ncbi:GGDEF domain-containing protein [Actinoplanes sp. G11-F43]|uniref:GGDEF domain-containing protein n=1 Tax=Actinoplanes sp. G11-F43 TaxID=3424130 RepID=UPI003D33F2F1
MRTSTVVSAVLAADNRRLRRRVRAARAELVQVRARLAKVQAASLRDPLTGAANRAGLMAELRRRSAGEGEFAVALIDLDKFKQINDVLGHAAGDEALIGVVSRLRAVVDELGGLVGRLGGDELVVVVPSASEENSIELGTDLELAVAEPIDADLWVSASIGLVHATPGDDPRQLLATADHLMYEAKAAGGGRLAEYDLGDELLEVTERPVFRSRELLRTQIAVAEASGRAER